ncbi:MAG: hypothetical protein M0R17_07445 [Candidatus Omnitrophica bacterium]|jgi:hypothetical protein|nr:hypothetical protein [Candidatus Omnitrophota bacterium]
MKYTILKIYVKLRHHLRLKQYQPTNIEKTVGDILINCLKNKKHTLLMSPEDKRYVKGKDIFVILEKNHISIINHKFSYIITLSEKYYNQLVALFDIQLTRERRALEHDIKEQIQDGLTKIKQDLY